MLTLLHAVYNLTIKATNMKNIILIIFLCSMGLFAQRYQRVNADTVIFNGSVQIGNGSVIINQVTISGDTLFFQIGTIKYKAFKESTAGGGRLSELDGVVLTVPDSGEVLMYNGTSWVNATSETGSSGTMTFDTNSGLDTNLAKCIPGIVPSDIVICTPIGTINANDILSVQCYSNYFVIQRKPGGTAYLQVNWRLN